MEMIKKHAAAAAIAAIVGGLAGVGGQHLAPQQQKIVQMPIRVAASKHAWPDLTQDETISIGEKIGSVLKGVSVSIFCNDSSCDDLAHDLDDVMQIANVGSTLERSVTPLGYGFSIVGPAGDTRTSTAAEIIRAATGGKLNPGVKAASDVPSGTILIAIGNKPR